MICQNCGARFNDDLERCPYCGTMNTKGAFKGYRRRLHKIKDNMAELDDDAYNSLQELIIKSLLKGLGIIAICVALGIALGFIMPRGYDSEEYEEETYNELLWMEENTVKLDEAYAKRDMEALEDLVYEQDSIGYAWEHYDVFNTWSIEDRLLAAAEQIAENKEYYEYNIYPFADALELLYDPENIFGLDHQFTGDEEQYYQDSINNINEAFLSIGLSNDDTLSIYRECDDTYGVDTERLESILKEVFS